MTKGLLPMLAGLFLPLSLSTPAASFELDEETRIFELHGTASNLLIWRSDSDFDPTPPFYNEEGQSVGAFTSYVNPHAVFRPSKAVELLYESELGINIFSRNNPDEAFPAGDSFMAYKHRQIYSGVRIGPLDLKAGYQRVRDPSDLFLSHWMGMFRGDLDLMRLRVGAGVGQLPDSTYEGIDLLNNNFVHDNVTLGGWASYDVIVDTLTVDAGVWYVRDSRYVRHPLSLAVPYFAAVYSGERFHIRANALFQVGSWKGSGVGGIDQKVLAWAASARARITTPHVDVDFGGFALSPDDDQQGNDYLGAFFYSGKNASPTLLLTEDELRDRYDNFDERMSGTWGAVLSASGSPEASLRTGPFYINRAGLAVLDVALTWKPLELVAVKAIAGAGFTLESANSAGYSYAGFESDLVVTLKLSEHAEAIAVGQLFLPGKASAVFINSTDREATEQVHAAQGGLIVSF